MKYLHSIDFGVTVEDAPYKLFDHEALKFTSPWDGESAVCAKYLLPALVELT